MGQIQITVLDPSKYDGRQYMSRRRYTPWPSHMRAAPGQLVTYFVVVPPGFTVDRSTPGLYWWSDAKFLHNQDNKLVVSVGAYQSRGAGVTSLTVNKLISGLIYTMNYGSKISCNILRGSRSTAFPHINPHPDGQSILFAGYANMTLLDLTNHNVVIRDKDLTSCNFRHTAQAPNGRIMAVINRVNKTLFELRIQRLDIRWFTDGGRVLLYHLDRWFVGRGNYTDEVECIFSPDSQLVAVTSSFGLLLVVARERNKLHLHNNTVPGLLKANGIADAQLCNARCADFDPRAKHKYLAVGCDPGPVVYVCDIDNKTIEVKIEVIDTEDNSCSSDKHVTIDCLRYSPRGRELVVATSDAIIRLYQPDLGELLYSLDGANCGTGISMVPDRSGYYPSYIRMSFTQMGDVLSVTATDGFVRVWQLQPDISLQHLVRMRILQYTRTCDLIRLPLPEKLILFLLQWPTL